MGWPSAPSCTPTSPRTSPTRSSTARTRCRHAVEEGGASGGAGGGLPAHPLADDAGSGLGEESGLGSTTHARPGSSPSCRGQLSAVQFTHSVMSNCTTSWTAARQASLSITNSWSLLTLIHAHRVSDTVQPSHALSSPSPPAFNLCQHQGLFQ